ncbi:MAG: hypothetical protein GTN89_01145, partial [Acidobacteria bacterium]|nr:hypothetical protein [Acidobacteriota bacterium]NIM63343.1 hypothetical protein [Acidobacteriota bacterium]NIO57995.1 hypothetical protein [Acidobacteriota bacterium]NIQ28997.1 hypothetical protein [Acidobacteriota bacterium]NIQ83517.1 hypothetical protein [Acidobacteriota bacterium]
MSGRRASAHVAIVLGSLVCLVSGGAQQPLTQEDVVRMFVQGVPEKELIRRIESLP